MRSLATISPRLRFPGCAGCLCFRDVRAEYWRAYRARRGESLRAYNRARRKGPKQRAQRYAQEQRRRARRRSELQVAAPVVLHPMQYLAHQLAPAPSSRGARLKFREELEAEDARSEAVVALLELRDPCEAIRAYRAAERTWRALTVELVA